MGVSHPVLKLAFAAARAAVLTAVLTAMLTVGFAVPANAQLFAAQMHDHGLAFANDITAGDLDSDGHPDVVVSGAAGFAVLVGDGHGGVSPPAHFGALNTTQAAIADMDLDGNRDVASLSSPTLTFYLGNGLGGFTGATTVAVPNGGRFAIGDLNGDGLPDFVGISGNGLLAGLNAGNAQFPAPVQNPLQFPFDVALADIDGNGLLDVVAVSTDGTLSYFSGNASATLAPPATQATGDTTPRLLTADIDQDGKPDVLVCGSAIRIFLGPALTLSKTYVADFRVVAATAADLNADGRADLCVSSGGATGLELLLGTSSHGLAAPSAMEFATSALASADLDGDGRADLLAAANANFLAIKNQGPAVPLLPVSCLPGSPTIAMAAGDVDGDGLLDSASTGSLGIGGYNIPGFATVFLGNGAGGVKSAAVFTSNDHPWESIALGDVTGDGALDLILGGKRATKPDGSAPENYLSVLAGNGQGAFVLAAHSTAGPQAYDPPTKLMIGDFDGDGALDVASFSQYNNSTLAIAPNAGGGHFGAPVAVAIDPNNFLIDAACADFDGDGELDFAVSNYGGVFVVFGQGGAQFSLPSHLTTKVFLSSNVLVGDLDADGRADILVDDTFFTNNGGGLFQAPQLTAPGATALADMDGDGFADWIGWPVEVRQGDGSGQFGAPAAYAPASASFPKLTIVGDIDGDGRQDLVLGGFGDSSLCALRNILPATAGTSPYGSGTAGCSGKLGIAAAAEPKVGNAAFALASTNAPPFALGLWLLSDAQDSAGSDPFGLGIELHIDLFAATLLIAVDGASGATGWSFLPLPIPNNPALAGATYYAQSLWLESSGNSCGHSPIHLVSSKGLAITIH